MLSSLIKIHLQGILMQTVKGSKNKKVSLGKMILMGLLFVYVAVVCAGMFGFFFDSVIGPFMRIGYLWLYFALMAIAIVFLGFIGSVFVTQQEIYGAKDNELLLAMPIKVQDILLSRIFVILILNYVYEALVALPGIVVYFLNVPFDALQLLFFIIVMMTLPLLVLALSCVFGWLMAMLLKKIRNKTIIAMILSIGFLLAYFYFISKAPEYVMALITNGKSIGEAIRNTLFPIYYLAIAICKTDIVSLLIYLACAIIPFGIVVILLSKNFISLATSKTPSKKIKLKESDIKTNSYKAALFKRELKHFSSNSMVMMNSAIGIAFTAIFAGILLVKGPEIISMLEQVPGQIQEMIDQYMLAFICLGVIGTSSMNTISASTISLEGNRLWIIKSLPIKTIDILNSKLLLHLVLCIPAGILCSIAASITFSLSLVDSLVVILAPIIFTTFQALFGLLVNLWKPKFDWVNETVVVKQSMAVMITMFASMGLVVLMVMAYVGFFNELMSVQTYVYILIAKMVIIDGLLFYLLNTWGIKRFEEL